MDRHEQTPENKSLESVISGLTSANSLMQEELSRKDLELSKKDQVIYHKELIIKKLQHALFGRKSEKYKSDSMQCSLFDELASVSKPEETSTTEVNSHTRKIKSKIKDKEEECPEGTFPEHLLREDEIIDKKPAGVAEEDLELFSEKVTERLTSVPQQHKVLRIVRKTYKQKSTGKLYTAEAPEHVFGSKCKVTEDFLVFMVIQKYLWHMPLYRQQQQLKLQGIKISRDSLVRWLIQLSELLEPVSQAIAKEIREAPWVHIDETPTRVGKGKKNKKYDNGYFWPILAPDVGVTFFYKNTRCWKNVDEVLSGYKGTIISDAYDGYENYVAKTRCSWQLCWMHIRRNFWNARVSNPERANEALSFIGQLYKLEEEFLNTCQSIEEKTRKRKKYSKPILDDFHKWLNDLSASAEAITDSNLSQAISYVLKRWDAACFFVYDGALPLDNGEDERAIRPTKLGLKNYLHAASEEGAHASAVFYSLIGSALMHGIHPFYYLLDLLKRIDQAEIKAEDLVPAAWKQRFYEEAIPKEYRDLIPKGSPSVGGKMPKHKILENDIAPHI